MADWRSEGEGEEAAEGELFKQVLTIREGEPVVTFRGPKMRWGQCIVTDIKDGEVRYLVRYKRRAPSAPRGECAELQASTAAGPKVPLAREVRGEAVAAAEGESETEVEIETEVEEEAETETEEEIETEADEEEAETETEEEIETEAEEEEAETETEDEIEVELEADSEPEADVEVQEEVESDADDEIELELEEGAPESEEDFETEAEEEIEVEIEEEASTEAEEEDEGAIQLEIEADVETESEQESGSTVSDVEAGPRSFLEGIGGPSPGSFLESTRSPSPGSFLEGTRSPSPKRRRIRGRSHSRSRRRRRRRRPSSSLSSSSSSSSTVSLPEDEPLTLQIESAPKSGPSASEGDSASAPGPSRAQPSSSPEREVPREHYYSIVIIGGWEYEWVPQSRLLRYSAIQMQLDSDSVLQRAARREQQEYWRSSGMGGSSGRKGGSSGRKGKGPARSQKRKSGGGRGRAAGDFRPDVQVHLPKVLKPFLIKDWELVTLRQMLFTLPARKSVDAILTEYTSLHETSGSPVKKQAVNVLMAMIKEYFDMVLGTQLLYDCERTQYEEIQVSQPIALMSQVYGGAHLLRLIPQMGPMLACTSLGEGALTVLLKHLQDFMEYLASDPSLLGIHPTDYQLAHDEYQQEAG